MSFDSTRPTSVVFSLIHSGLVGPEPCYTSLTMIRPCDAAPPYPFVPINCRERRRPLLGFLLSKPCFFGLEPSSCPVSFKFDQLSDIMHEHGGCIGKGGCGSLNGPERLSIYLETSQAVFTILLNPHQTSFFSCLTSNSPMEILTHHVGAAGWHTPLASWDNNPSCQNHSCSFTDFLPDNSVLITASKILQVLQRYRLRQSHNDKKYSEKAQQGTIRFLTLIYKHVAAGLAIPMCLPALPFKSPNTQCKVLGKLPDEAENLALAHLNGMCLAIQDIYPPGAKLVIVSDGLVYNGKFLNSPFCCPKNIPFLTALDLLGVPDRDVWAYSKAIRNIVTSNNYSCITFSRLKDLVSFSGPDKLDEIAYVSNAVNFRRSLLNAFGAPNWDWKTVSQKQDKCLTYRGYLKFLETDLQTIYPIGVDRSKSKYKTGLKYVAREMLYRGDVSCINILF